VRGVPSSTRFIDLSRTVFGGHGPSWMDVVLTRSQLASGATAVVVVAGALATRQWRHYRRGGGCTRHSPVAPLSPVANRQRFVDIYCQ